MKRTKRFLAVMLAGLMALSVAVSAASFSDVNASTPEGKAIIALADKGVLGGFEDGTFGPEKTVTRAQFSKIMFALKNDGKTDASANANDNKFVDVTSEKWFAGYVNWCASQNIVGGVGDGKFDPDSTLTMAQAIKMYAVAQGGAETSLAYPQGFIDFAKGKNYFKDVADFGANDPAPRGVIALIGYNTLASDVPVEDVSFTELGALVAVEGNNLSVASVIPTALPSKIDPIEAKNTTNMTLSLAETKTYPIADNCVITASDGQFANKAKMKEAALSDLVASGKDGIYTLSYKVENGKVTEIKYYKTIVPFKLTQASNGYLALPAVISIYQGSVGWQEIALGTFVESSAGTAGSLVNVTKPQYGLVRMAASGKPFRVDYQMSKEGIPSGKSDAFLFVAQTKNLQTSSVGVVTLKCVPPTIVPQKSITVGAGEEYTIDKEYLYEGIKYAIGAPFGGPAFLLYDAKEGKVLAYDDPKARLTTEAGGTVKRESGDLITYKAPATAGVDVITLCFNDGVGNVLVNINVVIE